jgi:hypothetical protein
MADPYMRFLEERIQITPHIRIPEGYITPLHACSILTVSSFVRRDAFT